MGIQTEVYCRNDIIALTFYSSTSVSVFSIQRFIAEMTVLHLHFTAQHQYLYSLYFTLFISFGTDKENSVNNQSS